MTFLFLGLVESLQPAKLLHSKYFHMIASSVFIKHVDGQWRDTDGPRKFASELETFQLSTDIKFKKINQLYRIFNIEGTIFFLGIFIHTRKGSHEWLL